MAKEKCKGKNNRNDNVNRKDNRRFPRFAAK
jgi:hypothetical protein